MPGKSYAWAWVGREHWRLCVLFQGLSVARRVRADVLSTKPEAGTGLLFPHNLIFQLGVGGGVKGVRGVVPGQAREFLDDSLPTQHGWLGQVPYF
jgi:hypothetical protein